MKKKLSAIIAMFLAVFLISGCGNNVEPAKTEMETVKELVVTVPDGLPAMSVAKLIKENDTIDESHKITYNLEKSTEALSTSIMKTEPDIAIVPSNMAAIAYNKTQGAYKIAGTTGWGSMYIGTTNANDTLEDLKGKEIYNIGKGLTPDIVTKTIFKYKGFDIDKDVNFSYVNGVTELAPIIISGKAEYAVVPEPALTTVQQKNEKFTTIIDLNQEWKDMTNSQYGYPQATIIVKKELIENDKEFVEKFLSKVKESAEFVYSDKEATGTNCEEAGLSAQKAVIIKSIDRSNIKFIPIKESYNEYKIYFEKLKEFDPSTLGGNVPDDEIFMEK